MKREIKLVYILDRNPLVFEYTPDETQHTKKKVDTPYNKVRPTQGKVRHQCVEDVQSTTHLFWDDRHTALG